LCSHHAVLLDSSSKIIAGRAAAPNWPGVSEQLLRIEKAIEELVRAFPEKKAESLWPEATR